MYLLSYLCKMELENGISCLISTLCINWNGAFSTLGENWNGTFQTICFFRCTVISRLFKNVCLYDNSNSFQSKMLYIVLIFKWSHLDTNLWICNLCICHITKYQINLDLIKIIQFYLKIMRHPHLWVGVWVNGWGQVKWLI